MSHPIGSAFLSGSMGSCLLPGVHACQAALFLATCNQDISSLIAHPTWARTDCSVPMSPSTTLAVNESSRWAFVESSPLSNPSHARRSAAPWTTYRCFIDASLCPYLDCFAPLDPLCEGCVWTPSLFVMETGRAFVTCARRRRSYARRVAVFLVACAPLSDYPSSICHSYHSSPLSSSMVQ